MVRFEIEPDEFGNWDVLEDGRVVDRTGTKTDAKRAAKRAARQGDTIQIFTTDGRLSDEFLVGSDGLVSAEIDTEPRERDRDGGGLFGAGLF